MTSPSPGDVYFGRSGTLLERVPPLPRRILRTGKKIQKIVKIGKKSSKSVRSKKKKFRSKTWTDSSPGRLGDDFGGPSGRPCKAPGKPPEGPPGRPPGRPPRRGAWESSAIASLLHPSPETALEASWEALENSGRSPKGLRKIPPRFSEVCSKQSFQTFGNLQ